MKMKKIFFASTLFGLSLLFASCSKDKESNGNSRQIKYEITGNFTGSLTAAFSTANGGQTAESVSGLPWTKEINYEASVSNAAMGVAGAGGVAGQTITVKVYSGGSLKSTTPATASSSGGINVVPPGIEF